MRKIFSLVLMMMCLLLGTVTAFANPYGGSHSFPAGMSPEQALQYFHHKITDRDFGLAYDILTDSYKNYFGSYDNFAKGYATTLFSRPESIRVIAEAETAVKLAYTLRATDWEGDTDVVEQTFECTAMMKDVDGSWMLENGTGKLVNRQVLHSRQAAVAVLKGYHDSITHKEMKAAWNLLGDNYKNSFGGFTAFCNGFTTTASSAISEATPVADGPNMTSLAYTLTAKDVTPETNVVQVFKGQAELEVVPGRGWRIMSARNTLVNRYFPPKW